RIAEAPISLAATICFSRVMKSFLSRGRSVRPATSSSIASLPPNHRPVTTEMHGAPTDTYWLTISPIVRSPISSAPSPSERLTSMMIGSRPVNRASTNRLGIALLLPNPLDRRHVVLADPSIRRAGVGVHVYSEEQRMRGELLVPGAIFGGNPAGEQERPRQLVEQRSDHGGVELLAGAAHAAVVADHVEQEHVDAGLLI